MLILMIATYCFVFIVVLTCALLEFCIDGRNTPVIDALAVSLLWPMFAVGYTWKYTKMFVDHMLVELSELR